MNKKAVELTMNTLIMAILGIVVLFILIAIFSGKITWFGGQYQDIGTRTFSCSVKCQKTACTGETVHVPLKKCYTDPTTFKTVDTENSICCEPKTF